MKKKTAEQLKCVIIDYLLQTYPNIIIGNEVIFGSSRNAVDLLAIHNNKIMAIEIKSKDDNLKRLPYQIEEYSKVYDKIIIFCSDDKINATKKIIKDTSIGLYCIISNKIRRINIPLLNKSTNKEEMLASMPAFYLKKVFKIKGKANSDEVRQLLSKKSKKQIHEQLLNFYKEKLAVSFKQYIEDKGEYSVIDDLPILSKESQIL